MPQGKCLASEGTGRCHLKMWKASCPGVKFPTMTPCPRVKFWVNLILYVCFDREVSWSSAIEIIYDRLTIQNTLMIIENLRNQDCNASQNVIWYSAKQVFFPCTNFHVSSIIETEFYRGGLDLQHRAPEMWFLSCDIEQDNFRVAQRNQIWTENKKSFEPKVLKESNIALQLPLPF